MNKIYQLRFLPSFSQDLDEIVSYISGVLQNRSAAMKLIDDIEHAIYERLKNPEAFQKYESFYTFEYPYYFIAVRGYVVYYVVIDDVMEVRRCLYQKKQLVNFS